MKFKGKLKFAMYIYKLIYRPVHVHVPVASRVVKVPVRSLLMGSIVTSAFDISGTVDIIAVYVVSITYELIK
jgi:hypothetical protein